MTQINQLPSLASRTSASQTGGSQSTSATAAKLQPLLKELVEVLVQVAEKVAEKSAQGGSLSSSDGQPSGGQSGSGQQRALDSAYHGAMGGASSAGSSTAGTLSTAGTTAGTTGSSSLGASGAQAQAQGTTGSAGSTSSAASTSSVAAVAPSGPFSETQLHSYITNTLQQTPGGNNSLSGPQNIPLWDPSTAQGKKNLDSFYDGIVSAQKQFYPEVPIDQFARLMVAHAAQESTLNPDIANGDGVIQANQSVRDDFSKYGQPLKDNQGNTIVTPGQANSKDPASCVMLWAWRTRSSLNHGGNGPAQWGQNVAPTQSGNLGNALSVWFQGPASQPFYKNGQMDTSGFHVGRIQDYFEKNGGSAADFQKLSATPLKT